MLHLHTTRASHAPGRIWTLFRTLPDQLAISDPGLIRLTLATRGTLSVLLMTLLAMLAAHLLDAAVRDFASGVTLSLMGPFLMREPTRGQRQRTLLMLALPAAAATIGTALLHGQGPAGDSVFLLLVFACFLFQPRSPRFIGIGLVAVVQTYVGLFLELPPATLGLQLLSIAAALPVIAFACFVVVPMRPGATLRRTVAAVQGRAARVLHSASLVEGDSIGWARLRRDLAALNEAALAADDQLALLQPDGREAVRAGLIDIELATTRLIEALRREKPGPRHSLRMRLHERRMRRGHRYAMEPGMLERGSLRASLVDLGRAAYELGQSARAMVPAAHPIPGPPPPPGPLAWRLAFRVTLAAGLAMAAGMALSPDRWFWAVMTVYVVFLNARSRGDTIHRGVQRLAGTLLGIASGLGLALGLAGHPDLQIIVLLGSVFGMFYFFLASYTVGIFCVTVMLGLLYGMMGASLETLLLLRLEETAIGAVAAILVAAFVMPTRTRDQVMRSGRGVLAALVAAVRASREAMSGTAGASPMEAMRKVDRQVADLRLAMAPLTAGRLLLRRTALERPIPALLECVHWTRVLAAASQEAGGWGDDELVRRAERIEARLGELGGSTARPQAIVLASAQASFADRGGLTAALDELERAVALLADRLEIGTLEGFALET